MNDLKSPLLSKRNQKIKMERHVLDENDKFLLSVQYYPILCVCFCSKSAEVKVGKYTRSTTHTYDLNLKQMK